MLGCSRRGEDLALRAEAAAELRRIEPGAHHFYCGLFFVLLVGARG